MLYRGDLRLLLSVPGGGQGGGAPMPDGTLPEPGGWNRIALQIEDLPSAVAELRGRGARFRNDIVTGVGVRQILIEDPSGNPVELFEPLAAYHERPAQAGGTARPATFARVVPGSDGVQHLPAVHQRVFWL